MDSDRHFRTSSINSTSSTATASGDLFICFTSRFSSSMKISSKSILSPGRAREPSQISLSTSLSCRLKSSGSLKGGQTSPMFPTGGKKRGSAFENPEPSSPKVTCIGQVRVKTKKQGKKMRARSVKRRSNSEGSFRKSESRSSHLLRQSSNGGNGFQQQECSSHRNQRWVHLPFTICEAVKAFGAELNCFLPCHSSCSSNKESKPAERSSESESSCGTVFARWLMAVQDNDGRGREIEVMVGEEEGGTEKENGRQRQHVFEGMDFKGENEVVKEEASRISICIPPKNALLLMRCRSDPVKMEELAKRFCESPAPKLEEEKERKVELNVKLKTEEEMIEESVSNAIEEKEEANFVLQEEEPIEMATENEIDVQKLDITVVNHQSQEEQAEEEEKEHKIHQEESTEETMAFPIPIPIHCESEIDEDAEKLESESAEDDESIPPHVNERDPETEEDENQRKELEDEEESENGENPILPSLSVDTERVLEEAETEVDGNWEEEEEEESRERSTKAVKETTTKATDEGIGPNIQNDDEMGPEEEDQSKERETPPPEPERESQTRTEAKPEAPVLPDCLLLMMYEPKLSMEVSKETWVCSTDFIRCVPTREKKAAPPPPPKKKRETKPVENITQAQAQAAVQPGRWSCSFPAAAAAAAMIEQKLARAKGGYEPFVLTRCKSEPMRSSANLAPDACFWKDRKLEPHRPSTFGVGAAGVGF